MPVNTTLTKGLVPVKVYTKDIDSQTVLQLENISQLPFIHSHIAAMPDVHLGKGATVGSVIPTKSAIIPAAVGVDIGCGMNAVQLSLHANQLPNNLKNLRLAIEDAVPVGRMAHAWTGDADDYCLKIEKGLQQILHKHQGINKHVQRLDQRWVTQMGSLGGGNHFIEICIDESQQVWLMLHSGSRGVGNAIGSYFINLAREDMKVHQVNLPDKDLAYFNEGTTYFDDYWFAVKWAQDYAYYNRQRMMQLVIEAIRPLLPEFYLTNEAINCHHNYVDIETHFNEAVYLTRKGAIKAGKGDLGIIPGSMGAKSYIVRGKGNTESFCSCAHGAGRKMSRAQAKKRFSRQDMLNQTKGVECRKDSGVLDEIPGAYKDIDNVMDNQRDLVDIVHTLKQVVCVKG